jgi:hypothetical protein
MKNGPSFGRTAMRFDTDVKQTIRVTLRVAVWWIWRITDYRPHPPYDGVCDWDMGSG